MEDLRLPNDEFPSGEEAGNNFNGNTEQEESQDKKKSLLKRLQENRALYRFTKSFLKSLVYPVSVIFVLVFILYIVPGMAEIRTWKSTRVTNESDLKKTVNYKKQVNLMSRDILRLSRKLNRYSSGQSYIVINTTDNRFLLYKNKSLIREGFCSSGSYTLLKTEGDQKWIFKTPKGKYWIRGKTTHPVWKRPDWSFVEEGLPIPPKDDYSRYEYGVLGDYALAIGDGYLIHGTIYKRFLGMPVTHGCVRLNDEDLKVIFNTLSVGSKVYIF